MARTRTMLSGLALALAVTASTGSLTPALAISGGTPAGEQGNDFTVLVQVGETKECSGVLVDAQWVLTAGGCFGRHTGVPAEPATVLVGSRTRSPEQGEGLGVVQLVDSTGPLTMARLAQPTFAATPARLPAGPVSSWPERFTASGFGVTATEFRPNTRQDGRVLRGEVDPRLIKLREDPAGSASVCQRDEGGPLTAPSVRGEVVYGVLIEYHGRKCYNGVSTSEHDRAARTDIVLDWITQTIHRGREIPGVFDGRQITVRHNGFTCLAADLAGIAVETASCSEAKRMRWEVVGAGARFQLRHVTSRQCLEDSRSGLNTAPCQANRVEQQWEFRPSRDNTHEVRSVSSDRNLQRAAVGGLVQLIEPTHSVHQRWTIVPDARSSFHDDRYQSFGASNPPLREHHLRHAFGLAQLSRITANSPVADRADATFRLVPGLGDSGCHSVESRNFPGHFLRHAGGRVRLDRHDGGALFAGDATWCAEAEVPRGGIRFRSLNLPENFLRHINGEVWNARPGGDQWYEKPDFFTDDSTFVLADPLLR